MHTYSMACFLLFVAAICSCCFNIISKLSLRSECIYLVAYISYAMQFTVCWATKQFSVQSQHNRGPETITPAQRKILFSHPMMSLETASFELFSIFLHQHWSQGLPREFIHQRIQTIQTICFLFSWRIVDIIVHLSRKIQNNTTR